jgi:hypothetical protein
MGVAFWWMLGLSAISAADEIEPRPWLCRDKPVFSSDRPIAYEFEARDGRQWMIFFMHLTPGAGRDDFTVVHADGGSAVSATSGVLAPGRYFAVAMYRGAAGRWTCPGFARDERIADPSALRSFCYRDGDPGCAVKLVVRRAAAE